MNTKFHVIRLRGPWQLASPSGWNRIHLPTQWSDIEVEGNGYLELRRSFGTPPIDPECEQIFLSFTTATRMDAWLNDEALGTLSAGESLLDVTFRLHERNMLRVELARPPLESETMPDVFLETKLLISKRKFPT